MFVINEWWKNGQYIWNCKIYVLEKNMSNNGNWQAKKKLIFSKMRILFFVFSSINCVIFKLVWNHINFLEIFLLLTCLIHYWNFSQFDFCWYKSWPLHLIYSFLFNFVQSKTWREIHIIASLIGWTFFCLSINCS